MKILFKDEHEQDRWFVTDDVVMGGVSRSQFTITENSTGLFTGTVSLENNGGFSSVRCDLEPGCLSGYKGLSFRVRGDGKRYKLYVKTGNAVYGGNFQYAFTSVNEEWCDNSVLFTDFKFKIKGKDVSPGPALDPGNISAIGFLISDKQAGPFSLEIAWIETL